MRFHLVTLSTEKEHVYSSTSLVTVDCITYILHFISTLLISLASVKQYYNILHLFYIIIQL